MSPARLLLFLCYPMPLDMVPFIYSGSSQGHRPWGQEVQHHCVFESSRNSGCSMRRALCSDQRTKYSVYSVHEIKTGFAWWPGSISLGPCTQPSAPSTTLATCPGFQVLPRCAEPGTGRCKMWWQGCPVCWVAQRRALPPQGGHRGWGRLVLPNSCGQRRVLAPGRNAGSCGTWDLPGGRAISSQWVTPVSIWDPCSFPTEVKNLIPLHGQQRQS